MPTILKRYLILCTFHHIALKSFHTIVFLCVAVADGNVVMDCKIACASFCSVKNIKKGKVIPILTI